MWRKHTLLIIVLLGILLPLQAQYYTDYHNNVNKNRLKTVAFVSSGIYVSSVAVLYFAWYQSYPQSNFHWINDNSEWMGMDKIGHAQTSYQIGNYGYRSLRWAGVDEKKAIWFGGSWGLIYMTTIEIFDGFSARWGASPGDLMSNTLGTGIFIGQQLLWHEQRLRIKWSYHPTDYPQYRSDLLGSNGLQSILKDYNGQTYWLSANIHSFLRKHSRFPVWLNVAVGYSANGMIGASSNPPEHNGKPLPYYNRTAQYYLTADVDWTKIKTRSPFLRFVFKAFSFIKFPFPTLEYNNENGMVFHWIYF